MKYYYLLRKGVFGTVILIFFLFLLAIHFSAIFLFSLNQEKPKEIETEKIKEVDIDAIPPDQLLSFDMVYNSLPKSARSKLSIAEITELMNNLNEKL